MSNSNDFNYYVYNDFDFTYKLGLNNEQTLFIQWHFKKGQNIKLMVENLLLQENISPLYMSDDILQLVYDSNLEMQKKSAIKSINEQFNQYNNNNLLIAREKQLLEEIEEEQESTNQSEQQKQSFYANDEKTRMKYCEMATKREFMGKIAIFMQQQRKHESDLQNSIAQDRTKEHALHSEEISTACAEGQSQQAINAMVKAHMARLQDIKRLYKTQFAKHYEEARSQFESLINELYNDDKQSKDNQQNINQYPNLDSNINNSDLSGGGASIEHKADHKFNYSYTLKLSLGMQKKYRFQIQLVQTSLSQYISNNNLEMNNKFEQNILLNHIYGIRQTACINLITLDKPTKEEFLSETDQTDDGTQRTQQAEKLKIQQTEKLKIKSCLQQHLPTNVDFHFETFKNQIIRSDAYQQYKHHKQKQQIQQIITHHSILGGIRTIVSILIPQSYQNIASISETESEQTFNGLFWRLNHNLYREVVFPMQLVFPESWPDSGTQNNEVNLARFGEHFTFLLRLIKRQLLILAQQCHHNHELKKVVILMPVTNQKIFDKSRQILQALFE